MQLNSLSLLNFRQHNNAYWEFPESGLILIQGPNGAGKSNLVKAIEFAISGKLATPREDNISWQEDLDVLPESRVELNFTHGNESGVITRDLHQARVRFNLGNSQIGQIKAVTAEMGAILGCSPTLLNKFVFLHQGQLANTLTASDADRSKILHSLLGTSHFESIRTALNNEKSKFVDLSVYAEDLSAIKERYKELKVQLKDARAQRQTLKQGHSKRNLNSLIKQRDEFLQNQSVVECVFNGLVVTESRSADIDRELVDIRQRIQDLKQARHEAEGVLISLDIDFASAQSKLASHTEAVSKLTAEEESLARAQQRMFALESVQIEEPRADKALEAAHESVYLDTKSNVPHFREQLEAIKSGKCSACGTTTVVLPDGTTQSLAMQIDSISEYLSAAEAFIEEHERDWLAYTNKHNQQKQEYAQHLADKSALAKQISDAKLHISDLRQATIPESEAEACQATVAAVTTANSIVLDSDNQLALLVDTNKYMSKQLDTLTKQIGNLKAKQAANALVDLVSLEAEIKSAEQISRDIASTDSRIESLKDQISDYELRLDSAKHKKKQSNQVKLYRNSLEQLRSILHRDKFPKLLINQFFNEINVYWSDLLSTLDLPFTAKIEPDTSIRLLFPDNQSAKIKDASGGQITCLSLAFALAIHQMFASSTGFIFLDEPTYGVDHDHIDSIVSVLNQLQTYAKSVGMQIFVVTHEQRLMDTTGHVITL